MSALPAGVSWRSLVRDYRRSDARTSVFQLVSTSALYVLVWWAALRSLSVHYGLSLALCLLGGLLTVRLFAFFHDCVHDSFFRSPAANRWVGRALGIVTLTPFAFWRRTHRTHHATSGNLDRRGIGDIDTLTVREYTALTPGQRFAYRLGRHPLIFLTIGPFYLFVFKHRIPFDLPRSWRKEWRSVVLNNLVTAAVIVLMCQLVGVGSFLAIQLPMFYVSAVIGMWLFYVQHQFPETYWAEDGDWTHADACLEGSSYLELPRVLRWFTADLGVHHIHHLCSAVPNYRLHDCMVAAGDALPDRRLTLGQSLRCHRYSLWDEEQRRLVSYREVETAGAGAP